MLPPLPPVLLLLPLLLLPLMLLLLLPPPPPPGPVPWHLVQGRFEGRPGRRVRRRACLGGAAGGGAGGSGGGRGRSWASRPWLLLVIITFVLVLEERVHRPPEAPKRRLVRLSPGNKNKTNKQTNGNLERGKGLKVATPSFSFAQKFHQGDLK